MQGKKPVTAVVIKRVLRQGGRFICGICRKTHASEADAERCLSACLAKQLNQGPAVVADAQAKKKRYRCSICKRIYDDEQAAKSCMRECRVKAQATMAKETAVRKAAELPAKLLGGGSAPSAADVRPSSGARAADAAGSASGAHPLSAAPRGPAASGRSATSSGSDDLAMHEGDDDTIYVEEDLSGDEGADPNQPRKQRSPVRREDLHKFLRDGRKLICRKCGAEHKSLATVVACYDSHPAHQKSERNVDDDGKYIREGAQYVCRQCGKKVFTRAEVVSCYDSHPEDFGKTSNSGAGDAIAASTGSEAGAAPAKSAPLEGDEKFIRDGARYVCRQCQKKFFTRGEVIACFDGHEGDAAEGADDAAAPAFGDVILPAAEAPAKAVPLEGDEKFTRDGAKYVCRKCNKKVFTRAEVIACYDGHG